MLFIVFFVISDCNVKMEIMKKSEIRCLIADFNGNDMQKKTTAEKKLISSAEKLLKSFGRIARKFENAEWMYRDFTENGGKLTELKSADGKTMLFVGKYKTVDYDTGKRNVWAYTYIHLKISCLEDGSEIKFAESCRKNIIKLMNNAIEERRKEISELKKNIEKMKSVIVKN